MKLDARKLIVPGTLAAALLAPGALAAGTGGSAPAGIDKPGWTLTFHDEFAGTQIDGSKWDDHYWSGRTRSGSTRRREASSGR